MQGVKWAVRQPFFSRWVVARIDEAVFAKTGLHLEARRLEMRPFSHYLILEGISLGGDLATVDRLKVEADFFSWATGRIRIWNLEVEHPYLRLDPTRVARIHIKPPDPKKKSLDWEVDKIALRGGEMVLEGGGWGLPNATCDFRIYGTGAGLNRVNLDLRLPKLKLSQGARSLEGTLSLQALVSKREQDVRQGELRLGDSSLQFKGHYEGLEAPCEASVKARLELAQLAAFGLPAKEGLVAGEARVEGHLAGTVQRPKWSFQVKGSDLVSRALGLQAGALNLAAEGSDSRCTLRHLDWTSDQGSLEAQGEWRKASGVELALKVDRIDLAPLGSYLHVPSLSQAAFQGKGVLKVPGDPRKNLRLEGINLDLEGRFTREGSPAGQVQATFSRGQLELEALELDLPEGRVKGEGKLRFQGRGLTSVQAEAAVETDAGAVAEALKRWKIVELDMSGAVKARAEVGWNHQDGLQLSGHADVETPRWHGARGNELHADVLIDRDQLRVQNIDLAKGKGRGSGELWLTWGKVAPGQDEMDMCYQAFRLPIEEGLNAWDANQTLPITGTGSGWVRIHGPYDRLRIEAGAVAEDAKVYGIRIPQASGDMNLDLAGDRLRLTDLKVAETPEALGGPQEVPTGLLALRGNLDMDLKHATWKGGFKGSVDSVAMGLSGPRFQAKVNLSLDGPWAAPFGPTKLPSCALAFNGGRLFLGKQSLEGLEGRVEVGGQALEARLQSADQPEPLAALHVWPKNGGLIGGLTFHVGNDSVDTTRLAARLSHDFMKDLQLDLGVQGQWQDGAFRWQGALTNTRASFEGFALVQQGDCRIEGDDAAMRLDLGLQAQGDLASRTESGSPGFLHFEGAMPFSASSPMGLHVDGQADLANIKKILDGLLQLDAYSLLGGLNPRGTARLDLGVRGTYGDPSLEGSLSLQRGSLVLRDYPQSVEDVRFNLLFKGRELLIPESEPLQGRLAQGNLKAWGSASWALGGLKNYDFQTRLEGFQLRDFPGAEGFELQGSLEAGLRGNDEDGGKLQGVLKADHMSYRAEISLGSILAYAMSGSTLSSMKAPDETTSMIDLDLEVKLKEPFEVDTNLVKVQGQPIGTFRFQNTLAEPRLSGILSLVPGGRITNVLPAGDIVIEEGSLTFDPKQILPFLSINGRVDSLEISPYVVNLGLKGPLDALKTTASSTPSLRQEEILQLLIDPSIASTVGSSVNSNTTTANSFNTGLAATSSGWLSTLALAEFQDRLRKSLRLDRVNVVWRPGTMGNTTTEITVGKTFYPFGVQTALVGTHQKMGDTTTMSGQAEWRFGNFVLQLGVKQTGSDKAGLAGEIRHTWIPFW